MYVAGWMEVNKTGMKGLCDDKCSYS